MKHSFHTGHEIIVNLIQVIDWVFFPLHRIVQLCYLSKPFPPQVRTFKLLLVVRLFFIREYCVGFILSAHLLSCIHTGHKPSFSPQVHFGSDLHVPVVQLPFQLVRCIPPCNKLLVQVPLLRVTGLPQATAEFHTKRLSMCQIHRPLWEEARPCFEFDTHLVYRCWRWSSFHFFRIIVASYGSGSCDLI